MLFVFARLGFVLALWEVVTVAGPVMGVPAFAIPGPYQVYLSLGNITPVDMLVTLLRVLISLAVSFLVGTGLALAAYLSPRIERLSRPCVRIVTAVPVISWILVAIFWFRGGEFRVGFVLVLVCAPVFYTTIFDGLRTVQREFVDLLTTYNPSKLDRIRFLLLPATLPLVFTAWRLNLSLAIRVVTVAELVGTVTGVGHRLAIAQELLSISDVLAWTLALVIALFSLDYLLLRLEERVLNWREPIPVSGR
ncbi:ABC transporter permease [Mesorhizobium captivum]|uniref:ABC transporter permease n=1 Tax=Mesorhizobium captivum TaxID=3072319 RepID=UPI002A24CC29|nr:ABC transporter permease subunit [Mesorhizobium sp. VK3C]MDX8450478.1 ABC transporter permease subunit [Mesorhizobium sp. VK3C]